MNPLIKLKYIKELTGYLKQDLKGLPIRERLATIKRMREIIELLGGSAASVKAELSKAQDANQLASLMLRAIDENKNIPNAFKRKDMDVPIDIKLGDDSKGLLHILKRREQDGTLSIITKEELFEVIAYTIVNGQKEALQDKASGNPRLPIKQGGSTVILVMDPKTNAWILTGWAIDKETLKKLRELPPDARRSVLLTDTATSVSSLVPDPNEGAGGLNSDSNARTQGNQDSSSSETADIEFIQKVIDGEIKPSTETLERMSSLVPKYDENKDMSDKVSQALNVWLEFLLNKADGLM